MAGVEHLGGAGALRSPLTSGAVGRRTKSWVGRQDKRQPNFSSGLGSQLPASVNSVGRKAMRRRVEFREVKLLIFPLVGIVCRPRKIAESDVVSLFTAACEGCASQLDREDLVMQAWMGTRGEARDGCQRCGHAYFVADVAGLTAEEEDRLTWDPSFAKLEVRYENEMLCPRCGFRNVEFKSTCTRCGNTDDFLEWSAAVDKLYGWCDRCCMMSLLRTWNTSSADEGWNCGDEFCGRLLVGKSGKRLNSRNVLREAWSERERKEEDRKAPGLFYRGPT